MDYRIRGGQFRIRRRKSKQPYPFIKEKKECVNHHNHQARITMPLVLDGHQSKDCLLCYSLDYPKHCHGWNCTLYTEKDH